MSLVDFRSHRPPPPHLDCPCGCGGHGTCNRPQPCPPAPCPPNLDGILCSWQELAKFKAIMTEVVEDILAKQKPRGLVNYSFNEQPLGITATTGVPLYQKTVSVTMPFGTTTLIPTAHGIVGLADVTSHDSRIYNDSLGKWSGMPYLDLTATQICDYFIDATNIWVECTQAFIDGSPAGWEGFITLIYAKTQ